MLEEAITALKTGNKTRAHELLAKLVLNEPWNESAWLALSFAVESKNQRIDCLQRVLRVNPGNHYARAELLKCLDGTSPQGVDDPASVESHSIPAVDVTPAAEDKIKRDRALYATPKIFRPSLSSGFTRSSKDKTLVGQQATPAPPARLSKARTKRPRIKTLRRRLHKVLSSVNRLVFYAFIVTLPFDLRVNVPLLDSAPMLLSRACLLTTLVLWLPAKLIEPRRRWFWGSWYTFIPLGLLLWLHTPQPVTESLLLLALYLFVVNEVPERPYMEVSLAFIVAVLIQVVITLWKPSGIALTNLTRTSQLVSVEALIPLGVGLTSRGWIRRSLGIVVSALVLAATFITFPRLTDTLILVVFAMLLVWAVIRKRMRRQLILMLVILVCVATGIALVAGEAMPALARGVIEVLYTWRPYRWSIGFLFALPLLGALMGELLKGEANLGFIIALPLFFIGLLTVLQAVYMTSLSSLSVWIQWLILTLIATVLILILLVIISRDVVDREKWVIRLMIGGMAGIFVVPIILPFAFIIGTVLNVINPALSWIAQLVAIAAILLSGWIAGSVVISLMSNLNIGCGGLVLIVAAIVSSLAFAAQSLQIIQEMWTLILGTVVGIAAWRSRRIWTAILSAELIAACLLAIIAPNTWLTAPQSFLLVTLIALWVDKSNIPLGIKIKS
jgi:hypothetical protein